MKQRYVIKATNKRGAWIAKSRHRDLAQAVKRYKALRSEGLTECHIFDDLFQEKLYIK